VAALLLWLGAYILSLALRKGPPTHVLAASSNKANALDGSLAYKPAFPCYFSVTGGFKLIKY